MFADSSLRRETLFGVKVDTKKYEKNIAFLMACIRAVRGPRRVCPPLASGGWCEGLDGKGGDLMNGVANAMDLDLLRAKVRELSVLSVTDEPVISCYLDLDRDRRLAINVFRQRAEMIGRGLQSSLKPAFEEAAGQIERRLAESFKPETKSAAIFARAGDEPYFLAMEFTVGMNDWVGIGSTPNIYQLVELKDTYHRYIVTTCSEKKVGIVEVNLGAATEQVWRERPETRARVGREWTRRHYQNHTRELTDRMIREAVEVLEERMRCGGYKHLVVVGHDRVRGRLMEALPKPLAESVIATLPSSRTASADEVVEATLGSFIEAEQDESTDLAERFLGEFFRDGLAVAGEERVTQAIQMGQVDVLLVAKEADESTRERMVRVGEAHGCPIELVGGCDPLTELGGVGCLMRYRAY